MLNERGLDSKGLKAKLIERLMAFEQGDEPPMQELVVSVARQVCCDLFICLCVWRRASMCFSQAD